MCHIQTQTLTLHVLHCPSGCRASHPPAGPVEQHRALDCPPHCSSQTWSPTSCFVTVNGTQVQLRGCLEQFPGLADGLELWKGSDSQ